jgi:hypothetical protein
MARYDEAAWEMIRKRLEDERSLERKRRYRENAGVEMQITRLDGPMIRAMWREGIASWHPRDRPDWLAANRSFSGGWVPCSPEVRSAQAAAVADEPAPWTTVSVDGNDVDEWVPVGDGRLRVNRARIEEVADLLGLRWPIEINFTTDLGERFGLHHGDLRHHRIEVASDLFDTSTKRVLLHELGHASQLEQWGKGKKGFVELRGLWGDDMLEADAWEFARMFGHLSIVRNDFDTFDTWGRHLWSLRV